jgi:lipopolysaccharide export system permease protein
VARVTLEEAQKPGLTQSQRSEWRKRADSAAFGIHDKIATPLVCVALILIAAPLGLRPQRSAGGFSLGLSLMILLIYYVVWTWATQVGKQGTANPLFMAYLPLALTLVVGGALTWKKVR